MLIGILGSMKSDPVFEPVNGSKIDSRGNDVKIKK